MTWDGGFSIPLVLWGEERNQSALPYPILQHAGISTRRLTSPSLITFSGRNPRLRAFPGYRHLSKASTHPIPRVSRLGNLIRSQAGLSVITGRSIRLLYVVPTLYLQIPILSPSRHVFASQRTKSTPAPPQEIAPRMQRVPETTHQVR